MTETLVKPKRVSTAEAVAALGGTHPTCSRHSPPHNLAWKANTGASGGGRWFEYCSDERTVDDRALDYLKKQLRVIPGAPSQTKVERLSVRTGAPRDQNDPGVCTYDLALMIEQHIRETGCELATVAEQLSQKAEGLTSTSAARKLHRIRSSTNERPVVPLARADELLLAMGHSINQSPVAVLPLANWQSAVAMVRTYFEVREATVSLRRRARLARKLQRFSAGYVAGLMDLDESQLIDVEPRPERDVEDDDEEVAA